MTDNPCADVPSMGVADYGPTSGRALHRLKAEEHKRREKREKRQQDAAPQVRGVH